MKLLEKSKRRRDAETHQSKGSFSGRRLAELALLGRLEGVSIHKLLRSSLPSMSQVWGDMKLLEKAKRRRDAEMHQSKGFFSTRRLTGPLKTLGGGNPNLFEDKRLQQTHKVCIMCVRVCASVRLCLCLCLCLRLCLSLSVCLRLFVCSFVSKRVHACLRCEPFITNTPTRAHAHPPTRTCAHSLSRTHTLSSSVFLHSRYG